MTGLFSITAPPSAALDNMKLNGLIRLSKEPYLRIRAIGRAIDVSAETFSAGARSISEGLEGVVARRLWADMRNMGWIG